MARPRSNILSQLLRTLEIERRRWFVEHDQTDAWSGRGPRDLDHLSLAYRETVDPRVNRNRIAGKDRVQRRSRHVPIRGAPIWAQAPMPRGLNEKVLRDGQSGA